MKSLLLARFYFEFFYAPNEIPIHLSTVLQCHVSLGYGFGQTVGLIYTPMHDYQIFDEL
jgi:uncharacterized membrane protein